MISGGTVYAYGYNGMAAIGGKNNDDAGYGSISITGGTIYAEGGSGAAGIGGQNKNAGGTITISDGVITAIGGTSAAGIGGGTQGDAGTITITGGEITATGGNFGSGIGSGDDGLAGSITITGGTITATGGVEAAGIGTGDGTDTTDETSGEVVYDTTTLAISITGGTITATGGLYTNGSTDEVYCESIGGGQNVATLENVSISGGVFANLFNDSYLANSLAISTELTDGYYKLVASLTSEDETAFEDISDLASDLADVEGLTNEQISSINTAAATLASYSSTVLASDETIVETVNAIDALFEAANDNITYGSNDVSLAAGVEELDETDIAVESAAVSGLALSVYGDGSDIAEETEVYIAVTQYSAVENEESDIVLSIKPYVKVGEEESQIDNADLNTPITITLELPGYDKEWVTITHKSEGYDTEIYENIPVVNGFITFTITHFSEFEITEGEAPVVASTSSSSGIKISSSYTVGGTSSSSTSTEEETTEPEATETPAATETPVATETPTATIAPVVPEETQADSSSNAWIWIVLGVLVVGGVAGVVIYKKKKQ